MGGECSIQAEFGPFPRILTATGGLSVSQMQTRCCRTDWACDWDVLCLLPFFCPKSVCVCARVRACASVIGAFP